MPDPLDPPDLDGDGHPPDGGEIDDPPPPRRISGRRIALLALALLFAGVAWWFFPSHSGDGTAVGDDDSAGDDGEAAATDPGVPPTLVDIANLPPTMSLEGARADRVSHHWVGEDGSPIALAKVLLADGRHTYCRLGGKPVAPVQCLDRAWAVDEWTEGTPRVLTIQEPSPEEDATVIAREGDVTATRAADGTVTIASDAAASPAAAPAPPTGS